MNCNAGESFRSAGERFRRALSEETPLQIVGVINAYVALMAARIGYKALYLSGAGVANMAYGLPDLGLTTLDNVLDEARKIIAATDLPLLVDIDTGWGNALMIARTIKSMETAGVAGIHIEDQVVAKRCGHRPGKAIVDTQEMVDRIRAAVEARIDPNFVIMARTDAVAIEGIDSAIKRAIAYREAGANMLFPEALGHPEDYSRFSKATGIPILANLTEFGKTPLLNLETLKQAGVAMALYPLSAARAMNQAAYSVLEEIRNKGTQKDMLSRMQTRDQLYDYLNYSQAEAYFDRLNAKESQIP